MGNNIGQLCFICPGGNVDARFEETKNKWCLNIVTNPNIISHRKGCTDFLLQAEIADGKQRTIYIYLHNCQKGYASVNEREDEYVN